MLEKLWTNYINFYRSYLVKGTLPKYNPPQIIESNIDNKLNP